MGKKANRDARLLEAYQEYATHLRAYVDPPIPPDTTVIRRGLSDNVAQHTVDLAWGVVEAEDSSLEDRLTAFGEIVRLYEWWMGQVGRRPYVRPDIREQTEIMEDWLGELKGNIQEIEGQGYNG